MEEVSSAKAKLYAASGILPLWHRLSFNEFDNDEMAGKKVQNYLKAHKVAYSEGYGLFLWGKNGVGKTHLMMCLLKALIELGYNVRTISLGTLIKWYTDEYWYNKDSEFTYTVYRTKFLEIEEVGKEYKSGETDLGRLVLDTVVRAGIQMKRPLLFTTNLTPEQMETTYTHDIASMLHQACLPVEVTGKDYRATVKFKEMRKKLDL